MENKYILAFGTEQKFLPNHGFKKRVLMFCFTFIRCFYPKRLTVHSGYTFVLPVCVFPGNRTHNLCAANAMLNE